MRKLKLIKKNLKMMPVKPNLVNYEKTYKKFNWKSHYKEIAWFKSKKMNAAYNAIDKHLNTHRRNKVALYWEGAAGQCDKFTFAEMADLSNKFANVLERYGLKKGDRAFILLPRIPELYFSFLGIIKTGAIAGTMFAAFGPRAIEDRLQNSGAEFLVTNSEFVKRVYKVKKDLPKLKHIFIVDNADESKGEISYWKQMKLASRDYKVRKMHPEDSAFMLYTSGTTGKPKGVVHRHLAVLHEHLTAKWVLDIHDRDVYWCTADPGWVTGIAYEILGSWSNGASTLVYEGRFNADKWYELIEKYRVSVWYTAPTAVRLLMAAGQIVAKKHDLSSLRYMCSVGEPLNPEPIYWSLRVFGKPFHDNFWQTETGGIIIANYPSLDIKPGSMGKPVPGIRAAIVDDKGKGVKQGVEGNLALKPPWPALMKEIWKRPKKFKSYFMKGWYITGDRAWKDKGGYFWFVGRADDVIKTAGERVGPFEVESALVSHPAVVESAVIGKPDPIRGEIIKAFVVLHKGHKPTDKLGKELQQYVKKGYAGHAYPKEIEFRDSLPKTQSGKIMRRVLKAQELGQKLGDISTVAK